MSTITEDEKVRGRHHMGYPNVDQVATFGLGIPAAFQTQFMIETGFNRVLPQAENKFRELLNTLDCIECEVMGGIDLASIDSVEDIKISEKRLPKLAQYYKIAQEALGNMLGVPPNPYDQREWLQGGVGFSIPVIG